MKNLISSIKAKILLGYFLLFIISSIIIYVIYTETVKYSRKNSDLNPLDQKVFLVNNILTNLYQAEGLERTYVQTGNLKYYVHYEYFMDTIYSQIDTLNLLSAGNPELLYTDSIRTLFDKKRSNLRELVSIKKSRTSGELMKQTLDKLSKTGDSAEKIFSINKKVSTNRDTIFIKQKKKSFISRFFHVFASNESSDSVMQVKINHSVQYDTVQNSFNPADSTVQYLSLIMKNFQGENNEIDQQLEQKEREILENNLTISAQLRQLLNIFKNDEIIRSFNELKIIQGRIRKTTWYIAGLGTVALLTIIGFIILILRDISKSQKYRKELERSIEYSNSLLKSKEQFMLTISHDIKSPLSSVIGYARLMNQSDDKGQKDHYLANITNSYEHVLKLITDLTDLSRLDSGKLKIRNIWFKLDTLIDDTFSGFYPVALAKNLEFQLQNKLDNSTDYLSDPVRIKQILSNLISNAIKFTEKGKVILKVSLYESHRNIDRIKIEVEDTGIGISEKDKKVIFNEFTRVSSEEKKQYEGAGLGLAITQRIVELMNGTVSLKSGPGNGSSFTIFLPLEKWIKPASDNQVGTELSTEKPVNKQIMLIDDDETLLDIMAETLEKDKMKTHKFQSANSAIQSLKKNPYDLILTDIQMPTMSGIELLAFIRNKTDKNIPVIAITGKRSSENENYPESRFSACLFKPFLPEQLLEIVNKVLSERIPVSYTQTPYIPDNQSEELNYNLTRIRKYTGNDDADFNKNLLSFIESTYKNLILFKKYQDEKDFKSLQDLAHKMLSMFRQIEAIQIIAQLLKIEATEKNPISDEEWIELGNTTREKITWFIELFSKEQNISV